MRFRRVGGPRDAASISLHVTRPLPFRAAYGTFARHTGVGNRGILSMGNHRADRRDTRPVNSGARVRGGGRRRAEKAPRHELTGLSMIPTVAGALALAVAAGGAVTAGA